MVDDLVGADDVPKVNFQSHWKARVVSTFGARVTDEAGSEASDDATAGTVFYETVE